MSTWVVVICNLVYKVWYITEASQTMSPRPAVICNTVEMAWDITTAPESTWQAVICNMVQQTWDHFWHRSGVNMASSEM